MTTSLTSPATRNGTRDYSSVTNVPIQFRKLVVVQMTPRRFFFWQDGYSPQHRLHCSTHEKKFVTSRVYNSKCFFCKDRKKPLPKRGPTVEGKQPKYQRLSGGGSKQVFGIFFPANGPGCYMCACVVEGRKRKVRKKEINKDRVGERIILSLVKSTHFIKPATLTK